MKVERIESKEVKKFEPVTLQITLETVEEFQNLWHRCDIVWSCLKETLDTNIRGASGENDALYHELANIIDEFDIELYNES